MHGDGMEALRLLGNAGFGAVEADGGGGISRGFGVGDLAGQHDAALNGLGQDRLARFGMLIPAEGLARQKGVAEPLEGDEGMTAALGFGQRGAEFLDAGVQVGGDQGFLSVVLFVVKAGSARRAARGLGAGPARRRRCAQSRCALRLLPATS